MTVQLELTDLRRAWIDEAAAWLSNRFDQLGNFTADDLHKILPAPAPHPNWYGCLVAKLRCSGAIMEVGRRKSARIEANGRKIAVWAKTSRQDAL